MGNNMKLVNQCTYYKTVFGSPVMALMPEAWLELVASNYIDEYCRPFEYDEEAFVRYVNGTVVGFITFKDYDTVDFSNVIEVGIGYVRPPYRKKGWYAQLYNALKEEAGTRGKKFIWSSVWANNDAMLAHAKSQGRKIRYIGIEDRL